MYPVQNCDIFPSSQLLHPSDEAVPELEYTHKTCILQLERE